MAKQTRSFKGVGIDASTLAGKFRLGRVQSVSPNVTVPNQSVQEIGSDKRVGHSFDTPEVSFTIDGLDVSARNMFSLAGVNYETATSGTYIEYQQLQYSTLSLPFKKAINDDIEKTLVVPCARLTGWSFNYSVGNQNATENFTFQGIGYRELDNDLVWASGTVAAGSVSFPSTPLALEDGSYVVSVYASGTGTNGYVPLSSITSTSLSAITFNTTDVPNGTFVAFTYHRDLSLQWDYTYQIGTIAQDPVAVQGRRVEIYLTTGNPITASGRLYLLQSVTGQAQTQVNKIEELGSEEAVGYTDDIPNITGTLDLFVNDFSIDDQLFGASGNDLSASSLGESGYGMLIKIFRSKTRTTPEKTIWIPALDITGLQDQVQVGNDVRKTYNWASRYGNAYIYKAGNVIHTG